MRTARGGARFGALLQRHREAAGLSQEDLAERAGLSRRGISDLERGIRHSPYPGTVRRLADALDLATEERAALLASLGRGELTTPAPPSPQNARLPEPLTSFVGREGEVRTVRELLRAARLVTLLGTGGVGKTRLAIEAARGSPDTGFVDLAPVGDSLLVPTAVVAALGLREQPNYSAVQTLIAHIAERELLLVVDNCEHLLGGCAALASQLLFACPGLRILATSRERLRVSGEQLWRVPPLCLPTTSSVDPSASDAVRLFVERARLVQPDFALDTQNAGVVGDICRGMDGIPLAIELAAARLETLGLEHLAARLDDRFRLLGAGSRTAPQRHQTLRAVIDWSHALLSDPEQRLFRRVSVFAGGWTLDMAEAVCAGAGLEPEEIMELLSALVQKSVVSAAHEGGAARYSTLETLRQYASECLVRAGDERMTRAQHVEWCLALAERADADKDSPRRGAWLARLEREHANLRAALDWSLADPAAAEAALRLVGALAWFWWMRGHSREGSEWMRRALERTQGASGEASARARAWALAEAGRLRQRQGDLDGARPLLGEALALGAGRRSPEAEACARLYLGELALEDGDSTAARDHLVAGLTVVRSLAGRGPAEYRFLHWLGHVAEAEANPREALSYYAEARQLAASHGDAFLESVATRGLASAAIEAGDVPVADSFLHEAVRLWSQVGNPASDAPTLVAYFARLAAAEGRPQRALRLAGAASVLLGDAGIRLFRHDRELLDHCLADARRMLTQPVAAALEAEGLAMPRDDVLAFLTDQAAGGCAC